MSENTLYIPPTVRPVVIRTVNRLVEDPHAVLSEAAAPETFILTSQTDPVTGLSYRTWIDPRTGEIALFRIIAPLGYSMTPYMDINARHGTVVNENRLDTSKWRYLLRNYLNINLPPQIIILLRNQTRFLMELERLVEGDPSFEDILSGSSQPVPPSYQVNHFVKTAASGSATLDMTVVSDTAWKRNKPTQREELDAALAKEDALRKSALPNRSPSPGAISNVSDGNTQEKSKESATVLDNEGREGRDENLTTWNDPLNIFSMPYWTPFLKKQFVLNKNIDAFDHNQEWVHPSAYKDVFVESVWVVADVIPKIWEIPPTKNSRSGGPRQGSRTYHLGLEQICAIHPADDLVDKITGKRKYDENDVIDVDAARAPSRRPFNFLREEVSDHSQATPHAESSKQAMERQTTASDAMDIETSNSNDAISAEANVEEDIISHWSDTNIGDDELEYVDEEADSSTADP